MINIQHVTLNHMAQPAKLYMAVGTKVGLAHKGHNPMDSGKLPL